MRAFMSRGKYDSLALACAFVPPHSAPAHIDEWLENDKAPAKPKTAAALPLLNYPGPVTYRNMYRRGETITMDPMPMTKAEYAAIYADYKGTRVSACGTHRVRTAMVRQSLVAVFLTDSKVHERPDAETVAAKAEQARNPSAYCDDCNHAMGDHDENGHCQDECPCRLCDFETCKSDSCADGRSIRAQYRATPACPDCGGRAGHLPECQAERMGR